MPSFDLPPSEIAKPLPVTLSRGPSKTSKSKGKPRSQPQSETKSRKRKRGGTDDVDDTPRAFKRLIALSEGKKVLSGLDSGQPKRKTKSRKAKGETESTNETQPTDDVPEMPKIRPGERLRDFSARVDAALPLAGLVSKTVKDGKDPLGFKVHRTRKERKMHKLYDQWRQEEAKIQAQNEEELEQAEEEELDKEISGVKWKFDDFTEGPAKGKRKKGKKGKWLGESAEREEDPWQELKKKRGEVKTGLHDVVQAPPELVNKPQKRLAVRGSAVVEIDSVPKAAGSLRRREELQSIRQDVVDKYRQLMSGKR
ncbi:hypothetical protein MKZ38_007043 [Zalerion maritima]|uniref:Urease accessory protein UreD n=1 Tax=Zalerion maritima TaxID=339359 RepID=A0AAD5RV79_9PEZI|nr:hypothetical protein MKZ38_007043 [Zalerion maritima]